MEKQSKPTVNTEFEKEINHAGHANDSNRSNRLRRVPDILRIEVIKERLHNDLNILWENKRLKWGMITLLVLAPLAKFSYLFFPELGFGEYFIDIGSIQIPNTLEGENYNWYWGTYNNMYSHLESY